MKAQSKTNASKKDISRRTAIKGVGAVSAMALFGKGTTYAEQINKGNSEAVASEDTVRKTIFEKVNQTVFIDTHEHILEERERVDDKAKDGLASLFSLYIDSDLLTAGMPANDLNQFRSAKTEPGEKWKLLEPYWPAVKNTGYGQSVRITIKELYGIDDLSANTVEKIQTESKKLIKPGYYKEILKKAKIESCQIDSIVPAFRESKQPELLMYDLSFNHMITQPGQEGLIQPTGIDVKELEDWHKVIDWWFNKYGKYASAVKSQHAYSRNIDHEKIPAEQAAPVFKKIIGKQDVTAAERKRLEDHLFWYAVGKATSFNLPIKLHTGYYAFQNTMPLSNVQGNPAAATDLCRLGPEHRFVFMHICYPYYEQLIAVAKHYTNAYIDMCWSWIINPVAAKDFLKKYLVTAPANKVLTFGGDYNTIEPVVGHAAIARWGITLALTELVEERLLSLSDAMELIDPFMHGNARKIFDLDKKTRVLRNIKW